MSKHICRVVRTVNGNKEIVKDYNFNTEGIEQATEFIERANNNEENVLNGIYYDIEKIEFNRLITVITEDNAKEMSNEELLHQLCEHYFTRWNAYPTDERTYNEEDELLKIALNEILKRMKKED